MNWSYPMMKLTSNTIILEGRVPMTLVAKNKLSLNIPQINKKSATELLKCKKHPAYIEKISVSLVVHTYRVRQRG